MVISYLYNTDYTLNILIFGKYYTWKLLKNKGFHVKLYNLKTLNYSKLYILSLKQLQNKQLKYYLVQ